jgi:hypothetical protein
MKKILSLFVICLTGCVSVDQQGAKPQGIKIDVIPASKDMRIKEAKKPFTYLRADKMKVLDGMEKDYLKIEKQWKEIHEKLMSDGKRLSWSVWKPKDNNLGYDYVTVQTFDSLDSMDTPFDWKEIGQSIGAEKLESILNKTPKTRENVGSEIWKLEGWTELTENKLPDSLGIGFMTPAKGKDSEYAELEKKYFSKFWQEVAAADENILGWQFARLLFSNGNKVDYKYYTLHTKDSSKKSISQKKRNEIWEKVNSDFPSNVKMNELRQMKGVEYELVFRADPLTSAINQEWKKLQGSWKHTYEDGGYRIKRISPYKEVLEIYSKDGVKKNQYESPMKIEIKNGLKYFYSIHTDNTWRSIYNIKDGKWYEQLRGIFGETNANPNDFLVYERID